MVNESIKPKEPRLAPSFQHLPGFGTGLIATDKVRDAKLDELAVLKAELASLREQQARLQQKAAEGGKPGPNEAMMPEGTAAELEVLKVQVAELKEASKQTKAVEVSIHVPQCIRAGFGCLRGKTCEMDANTAHGERFSIAVSGVSLSLSLRAAPCRRGARRG